MKARLLYARLDALQEDYTGNDPEVVALRYATDYDAETARAEQLQTWNDELRTQLREIRAQQKEDYARADRAEAAYKELAQIVEGLQLDEQQSHYMTEILRDYAGDKLADAIARLLAWRQQP